MTRGERRGRVRLRPGVVTFVAVRPDFDKLGRLIDIGQGGLSFQYVGQIGETGGGLKETTSFEIDLFLKDRRYYLPGMPCVVIYDRRSEQRETFPPGLEFRRCGLKFGELEKEQVSRLDLYLETYAALGIPSRRVKALRHHG
jgi:hypothetical protein